ncbi:DUF1796 family putative cysteine peptidase [Methylobacterium sp. A54F]
MTHATPANAPLSSGPRESDPRESDPGVIVAGLGTLCLTSHTLKQMGLKESSMPFDWIFSSPGMVAHAIRDDFGAFLDRRNMQEVPVAARPDPGLYRAENLFYKTQYGVHYIYNHHNPESNDADYAYFVRCVDRFRRALAGDRTILFVMLRHCFSRPDDAAFDDYAAISELVRPHALLCVETYRSEVLAPRYEVAVRVGNLEIGRLRSVSACNGLFFDEPGDFEALAGLIRDRADALRPNGSLQNGPLPSASLPGASAA